MVPNCFNNNGVAVVVGWHPKRNNKGVLFVTYALLVTSGGKRMMDQMIQWLTGNECTTSGVDRSFL
jgi:hypothetical protein